jgi:hypothetical protein
MHAFVVSTHPLAYAVVNKLVCTPMAKVAIGPSMHPAPTRQRRGRHTRGAGGSCLLSPALLFVGAAWRGTRGRTLHRYDRLRRVCRWGCSCVSF